MAALATISPPCAMQCLPNRPPACATHTLPLTPATPSPLADAQERNNNEASSSGNLVSKGGVELGPIGMTFGGDASAAPTRSDATSTAAPIPSIASMTTAEWRAKYEKDGTVDLWLEEEFNAGSRLVVSEGRMAWRGACTCACLGGRVVHGLGTACAVARISLVCRCSAHK